MALLSLAPPSYIPRYTGLTLSAGVKGKLAPWKTAYMLSQPLVFSRQGELYDTERLTPNHTYVINFGRLKIKESDILFRINPELCDKGIVSAPTGFHNGYEGPLQFTYRPFEAFDIKELEYVASISILN